MQITAVLSDYDGTLCTTSSIKKPGRKFHTSGSGGDSMEYLQENPRLHYIKQGFWISSH
jgi:hypothetical protein